jgi:DNA-binding SARP family transcriptional activator/tetratricopeptide (TPR) repeat protein
LIGKRFLTPPVRRRREAQVEFHILGPPEVIASGRPVILGGRRQRTVLAMLLANAHQVVSVTHLVDAVWEDAPPSTARRQVQNLVGALRRLLATGEPGQPGAAPALVPSRAAGPNGSSGRRADAPLILADGPGYRIAPSPGQLDAQVFADRVSGALSLAEDRPAEAADRLRSALSLWRGAALLGLSGRAVEAAATRLEEQRLAAYEQCVELELRLGRHAALVGELTELVAAHPLRERMVGHLMLALHRCDRQADAFRAYHRLRAMLADELGIDPGQAIQQLYANILRNDPPEPAAAGPAGQPGAAAVGVISAEHAVPPPADHASPIPAQLPAEASAFTGRGDQLSKLDELLAGPAAEPGAVVISAITGMAGVGKTALAVHWGHRVRDRFPDGQLYVNLRGYDRHAPMPPIEALAHLLHALKVPTKQIPSAVQTAGGLYRSLLADRRVLVVLDNAADADQVRPLLPASPGCVVLVTSRDRLSGLVARDGARRIALDVLTPDEARTLLGRILGEAATGGPAAVDDLARACSYLPLALRVAAANVAACPWTSVAEHAAALRGSDGLSALEADDEEHAGVRRAFDLSLRALDPDTGRLFRLAGLAAGPDLTAEAAAALTGVDVAGARRRLNRLTAAHLLTAHAPGRYGIHDLLRQYAVEQTQAAESEPERNAALELFYGWYLARVEAAARVLFPQRLRLADAPGEAAAARVPAVSEFEDHAAALAWMDAERANLVTAVRATVVPALRPIGRRLADLLGGYLRLRKLMGDWARTAEVALSAAETDGDQAAQVTALISLGGLHHCRNRYPQAVACFEEAHTLAGRLGWSEAEATALSCLGSAHRDAGALREAAACNGRALTAYRRLGSRHGEAVALDYLGRTHHQLGRLAEAAECYTRALRLYREVGASQGEVTALHDLGEVRYAQGRLDEAVTHLNEALAMGRRIGDRCNEAYTLRSLAVLHRDLDRPDQAERLARAAVGTARELGDRRAEGAALNALAAAYRSSGRNGEALAHYRGALTLARATGDRYGEAEALLGLAAACRALRMDGQAVEYAQQALVVARRFGFRILRGLARTVLQDSPAPVAVA